MEAYDPPSVVFRKELDGSLENAGSSFKWADIKQELEALEKSTFEEY